MMQITDKIKHLDNNLPLPSDEKMLVNSPWPRTGNMYINLAAMATGVKESTKDTF